MNKYLNKLLYTTNFDTCLINFLIENNILTIEDITQEVIRNKNAGHIYFTAQNIKKAPIKKLETAILQTDDARYIYLFLLNIPGASAAKFIKVLKDLKAYNYLMQYALLKPKYLDIISDIIITSNDRQLIDAFKKQVKDLKTRQKLEYALENCSSRIKEMEDRFVYLIKLYKDGNYQEIKKQKEFFKEVFTSPNLDQDSQIKSK